ncbi:MAG: guanylate cyclase [Gaiellaceae bacterium]|nr:MAG: guanylate cyclase [Gaiellaceae bacterium]
MSRAPRRERKVVTVVFCDLVGFTARAESMDPEDVEALLRPYHERVRSELERHGGTVEKFIGDAVMALFGAPTAHEDDPERAVRAALAIREFALEEGLELRVGVTTGEALVRLDARPEGGEGMASGDVVNTAARLQAAAPVNGVIVDEPTYRATRQAIDYEDAEPVEAKGKSEPIAVWQATRAHARLGVDVAHDARSPLVGRARELAAVQDAFERARHGRTPQLLTIVGVPGMGKSRLVWELQRIVDADPELITWRQGRCLAYGDGVTLWALAEIVKAEAGISEQDSPADVAAKLRAATVEAVLEADVSWVESHLLALVGLAEEAELGSDRRNEAFSAWRAFLEGLAEQRPLVVVFEDLHWADETLLDFVDELVDWIADVPLLVVATARPELLERRPGWGGGKLNATTITLSPLTSEETAQLLASALGTPVLPAETQATLLERAGGNPLYAEQFAELYVERGSTDELALPETLQGIIAARLDGLSLDEKALLQDAAVVGKVFWAGALGREEADVVATLHSLERKGFVRRQRRSSVEGQGEIAFAHALVRDVAYGQIPRAERAAKHRRVAEWIESLGRPEDHAEMRAYHWRSALDLTRAAGAPDADLAERARLALRDAGDRAAGLNSHTAAASFYDEALALWSEGDADRADLLFRLARALFAAYNENRREQALVAARDALLAAGDPVRAGEAESFLANVAWDRGHDDEVRAHLARARELVGDSVSASAARVLASSARILELDDEFEAAMELAQAALEMASELGLDELRAHALTTRGMARNDLDPGSGTADIEQALELALEIDSPIAAAIVNNLGVYAMFAGDIQRADELYAEAQRLGERFGNKAIVRFTRGNRIWADFMLGRWDRALEHADEFVAECEAGSPHTQESNVRTVRAMMREARGDAAGALEDVRIAVDISRDRVDRRSFLGALATLGSRLAAQGQIDAARETVDELVPIVRVFGPHGALTQLIPFADVLDLQALDEAMSESPAMGAPRWREAMRLGFAGDLRGAADVIATSGALAPPAYLRLYAGLRLLEEGRRGEGRAALEQALGFYRSVDATYYVSLAEAALAKAQSESA